MVGGTINRIDDLVAYLSSLQVTQGRLVGEPFEVLPWQRRFLRMAFGFLGDRIRDRQTWRTWDSTQAARLLHIPTGASVRCIGSDPKRMRGGERDRAWIRRGPPGSDRGL